MSKSDQHLILVLGDQLSLNLSSLRHGDKSKDVVLMAEVMAEATYARHHKKKFVLVFSAMRHFAEKLRREGWNVDYVKLEDDGNTQSLKGEVQRALKRYQIAKAMMTEPGEWRLQQELRDIEQLEDTRFICSHGAFRNWASGRKELRMEYFYRDMRRQTGLLMQGDKPEGEKWNFDSENRKPAKADLFMPEPLRFVPDQVTRDCIELTLRISPKFFGAIRSVSSMQSRVT